MKIFLMYVHNINTLVFLEEILKTFFKFLFADFFSVDMHLRYKYIKHCLYIRIIQTDVNKFCIFLLKIKKNKLC